MVTAITPGATLEYSLAEDEGPDKTVFILEPLDPIVAAHVKDKLFVYHLNKDKSPEDEASISFNKNELDLLSFRLGVKGWRNFRDDSGKEIGYRTESYGIPSVGPRPLLDRRLLVYFRPSWISEIAAKVQGESFLSEDDRKNSGEPSH